MNSQQMAQDQLNSKLASLDLAWRAIQSNHDVADDETLAAPGEGMPAQEFLGTLALNITQIDVDGQAVTRIDLVIGGPAVWAQVSNDAVTMRAITASMAQPLITQLKPHAPAWCALRHLAS